METIQNNIFLGAMLILILALIWATYRYICFYKKEHFTCPSCRHSWKPPVPKMLLATNAVNGKIIQCPKCNVKSYIEPTKD